MAQLKQVINSFGAANKPIWVTEHSWWSTGQGSFFAQGDYSARAQLLYREWGIDRWAYFIAQGTWGNNDLTFSAIEGNDLVKPAALALMTQKAETRSRPFQGTVNTGTPHTHVQKYGPAGSASDSVLAVWSEDMPVDLAPARQRPPDVGSHCS